MSGLVGVFNLDGAHLDPALVSELTGSLHFRGPDAKKIWIDGAVAFGHTLLQTAPAGNAGQPFSLDGKTWIVADARIDDRRALITELARNGQVVSTDAADVEVILRAYCLWQEHCVDHLLGDFLFAIWDANRRLLFCARDQMGVKPFYYSLVGPWFIFSNTLDCVRMHPAVSDRLNELAVADFLISTVNEEVDTTFFADIRRLPPAHTLVVSEADGLKIRRYWQLPVDEPLCYRRAEDYVVEFRELLKIAVNERLSPGPVGIFMSGGLDSTAIAATAVASGPWYRPQAFTSVYDEVIPHDERHYAGLVASFLMMPIHYRVRDKEPLGWNAGQPVIRTPEPVLNPLLLTAEKSYWEEISSFGRVFLFGEGPDNALYFEWRPHFRYLIRRKEWLRVFSDFAADTAIHRQIPFASRLGRRLKGVFSPAESTGEFPGWINEEFAQRLDLKARWEKLKRGESAIHPLRPQAYRSFTGVLWPDMFENMDPTWTGVPIEVRHPFVDLRLLRFMLSVPTVPWCRGKYLLRQAMRGLIPEPVRRRPKTPVPHNPILERLKGSDCSLPDPRYDVAFDRYVNRRKLPEARSDPDAFSINLRVLGLNYWLHGLESRNR